MPERACHCKLLMSYPAQKLEKERKKTIHIFLGRKMIKRQPNIANCICLAHCNVSSEGGYLGAFRSLISGTYFPHFSQGRRQSRTDRCLPYIVYSACIVFLLWQYLSPHCLAEFCIKIFIMHIEKVFQLVLPHKISSRHDLNMSRLLQLQLFAGCSVVSDCFSGYQPC